MKRLLLLCLLCLPALLSRAYLAHFTTREGLSTPEVWQIMQLPNRQILVQTVGGFSLFDGGRFEPLLCPSERAWPLKQFGGYAHLWQGDSLLWLRDYYHAYLLDTRRVAFLPVSASRLKRTEVKAFLNGHTVSPAARDSRQPHGQQLLDSLLKGRNAPQATCMCRDHEGGIWVGTLTDGIYYWRDTSPWAAHYPLTGIRAMARAGEDLLLLGGEHDLLLFDTRQLRVVSTLKADCGRCHDAMRDAQGRVWVSAESGLYCYEDGRLSRYHAGNCQGLLHSQMRFARGPLPDGRMLVCNLQHYLGLLDTAKGLFTPLNTTFRQLESHRLLTDACALDSRGNRFVLCSQNGMRVISFSPARTEVKPSSLPTEKFNCTYRDRQGRMWIGTQNGLLLLQQDGYRRFTHRDGLQNLCVNSLVEDAAGQLWIGTAFGIEKLCVKGSDTVFVSYSRASGMPEAWMCERAAAVMPDGKVWMASAEGLVGFSPLLFGQTAKRASARVLLLAVENDEAAVSPAEGVIRTAYRHNNLLVKCVVADLATASRTRYRYRLEGLDDSWTVVHHADGPLLVRYRALPPGTYRLQLQAACDTEAWGALTEQVIKVLPPFWLSVWAKATYVLLAVLAVLLAIRLYMRRLRCKIDKENEEKVHRLFELREEARHQFAQNLHVNAQKLSATHEEARFMEQLLEAIEQNMPNADYTVDQLAADVAMGRSNLYRRMQLILGITPNDFLRSVRLKRAATLLAETALPVGDVARAVGFSSPRYFSQYFKKMFGVTPSAYGQRGGRCESERVEELKELKS